MSQISIRIVNGTGETLAAACGKEEVYLVYGGEYREGDCIYVEITEKNRLYWLQLDDGKGRSLVYLKGNMTYEIPFGEKRLNLSPKVFCGTRHLLSVKRALDEEAMNYRNLALNVWDRHGEVNCYPHASANVETRGEAVFAAMNAIDGVTASDSHGEWPYGSWGINRREDACFRLDFGREIETDRLVLYTRADFPHDNWWKQGTVHFSDDTVMRLALEKTGGAQQFLFEKKKISWLELDSLIKSEEPSPFPALVQIEVYGRG